MRTVSPAHAAAMAARVRELDATVEVVLGGPMLGEDPPTVSVTMPQARISHPSHLADALSYVPVRYAVLGEWRIEDPQWGLAPTAGDVQMGVWSSASYVAASDGTLSPPATVTVQWTQSRAVYEVTVAADARWPGVPLEWTVELRAGGVAVASGTVSGSGHVQSWATPLPPVIADELVVTVTRWTPGERVRLVEVSSVHTVTLTASDLLSVSWLSELMSEQGEVSADEVACETMGLSDPDEQDWLATHTGLMMLIIGPRGLDGVRTPPMWVRRTQWRDRQASLVAEDAVALLAGREWPGYEPTQAVTLADLLDALLAGVPHVVDPSLASTVLPWAAWPRQAVREALADLARLFRLGVWTDDAGRIAVRPIGAPAEYLAIAPSDVYSAEVPLDDRRLATRVEVSGGPLELAPPAELGSWSATLSGTAAATVTWDEPATARTVQTTGCTIQSVIADEPCRWVGVVSGSGQATVAVSGQVLRRSSQLTAAAEDAAAAARYGWRVHRVDHLLIQTQEQAQELADALLAERATVRPRLILEWRGDLRLEPGDGIEWDGRQWMVERVETVWRDMLRQRLTCRRIA